MKRSIAVVSGTAAVLFFPNIEALIRSLWHGDEMERGLDMHFSDVHHHHKVCSVPFLSILPGPNSFVPGRSHIGYCTAI
jgi:hypothetical protein